MSPDEMVKFLSMMRPAFPFGRKATIDDEFGQIIDYIRKSQQEKVLTPELVEHYACAYELKGDVDLFLADLSSRQYPPKEGEYLKYRKERSMENLLDFSGALTASKDGFFITRQGWNGKGQFAFLKKPLDTDIGAPTVPHFLLKNAQGDIVPWTPSQGDLFAEDWRALPNEDASEVAS